MVMQRSVVVTAEESMKIDIEDFVSRQEIVPNQVITSVKSAYSSTRQETANAIVLPTPAERQPKQKHA